MIFAISLLKGKAGTPSLAGISCGSRDYWLVVVSAVAALTLFTLRVRARVLSDTPAGAGGDEEDDDDEDDR
jgi:hypothetical protein